MEGEGNSRGDELRRRGERLRRAVDVIGSRRVAEQAGVPYTTLRGYMAGGDMKLSVLAAVARACGVTIDWIAYGKKPGVKGEPGLSDDPTASAATTALAGLLDLHRLAARLGLEPEDLVAFTAFGDAMEPAIRDGDLLVARRVERVVAPAIYGIRTDGDMAARRLEQRVDGTLIVSTDNPRYGAQVLQPGQAAPFEMIGPIVWLSGPIRN